MTEQEGDINYGIKHICDALTFYNSYIVEYFDK